MVYFVLNNLCSPAGVGLDAVLQLHGLILDLDGSIALARARTTEKRQSSLLGVIRTVFFNNLGVEHHSVCRSSSALVKEGDDALLHTDHIRYHADTAIFMCH